MFGLNAASLAFVLLAGFSAAAISYVVLFSRIEKEKDSTRRFNTVRTAETDRTVVAAARDRVADAAKRRKTVQDSLADLEKKEKLREKNTKKPPFKVQMKQAGFTITLKRFYVYSGIFAVVFTLVAFILGAPAIILPGILLSAGLGLPRWWVSMARGRRVKKFLNEFPNALDIIIRAVKSGLPLNDGVRLIATEAPEPVRGEFRRIIEAQQVGMSISEAAMRMPESMPCSEAAFFGIVIQIQQQAGGNLSEALGNLSRVLRDRKKMKAKVDALSMEAKASAAIIGALPFIVGFLVYLSSPSYIMPLFTTSTGHLLLGIAAFWMSIGILVMKKMINFDL